MKNILLGLLIGILIMINGCGMNDKIKNFKDALVIEKEYGDVNSVLNYKSIGTVDEIATSYMETLGLNKADLNVKIKVLEENNIYLLIYKGKKQKIEFGIYFDDNGCSYSLAYLIRSNNQEYLKEFLNSIGK